jgi:hypothetical protein
VTAALAPPRRARLQSHEIPWTRAAPTLVAATLAAAYVIVSPPSVDLAAHLFRAHLARQEGLLGVWNNYWYGGHSTPGYSVLFPGVSAVLSPQLAAALAATATAAVFEPLARRHYGPDAWLGAALFAAATAIDLFTGRLALAFGALPALGAIAAIDRRRTVTAVALAALSALCSPVAALFAALAAAGVALSAVSRTRRARPALAGAIVATAALLPIVALAVAFPEGGTEPFALATLIPLLVIAAGALTVTTGSLRTGVAVYALACIAAYALPSPVGSNIARLGTLLAAPLAGLALYPGRKRLLALVVLPLLYVGWQAPVLDVASTAGDPSTHASYYAPLLRFLGAQRGAPFRTEIPLTRSHWEAYYVATRFPLARGWERQLDIADNPLFYSGRLTARTYDRWLHNSAVRFVALAEHVPLDYSARGEAALIRADPPYLRLVMRTRNWRVYAVVDPTPIVTGAATLTALGPDWLKLSVSSPGTAIVRVRFTPYWRLAPDGCVSPDGPYTRLTSTRAGAVTLGLDFSLIRVQATSPRC